MDALIIEPTEDSPSVIFDMITNRFVISGKSRPENSEKFFSPVIKWITQFGENISQNNDQKVNNQSRVFVFNFEYFNSISAKYFLDILFLLKDIVEKGNRIDIQWHYSKLDDDMLDTGKEFSNLVNLKFDFIEY